MNQYEMVVLIVAVVMIGAALKHAIGPMTEVWREHLNRGNGTGDEAETGSTQAQLAKLEELLGADLDAFNRQALETGLPAVANGEQGL